MLLQRGINLIDNYGNVLPNDPRVAETLAFYAQLVAGPRKVPRSPASGDRARSRKDLADGNLLRFITPDWHVTYSSATAADDRGQDAHDAAAGLRPDRRADQHLGRHDDRHHQGVQEPGAGVEADRVPLLQRRRA